MIVAISILGVLVVVLGFTTINLLRKNEKQEDILLGYLKYLENFSNTISFIKGKLKEIDHKGTFESDDEVGFFFEEMKKMGELLNEFIIQEIQPKDEGPKTDK